MAWTSEILNRVFNAAARALNVKIVDGAGAEKFTDMNPGSMQLTGSLIEDIHDAVNDADPAEGSLLGRIKSLEDKIDAITSGDTPAAVQLTGSILEIRDLAANKPSADAVPIGAIFWAVDTDPHGDAIEVSDGTKWAVI